MIINNLNITINGKHILKNISFTLNDNEKVGLIGTNGSGKSTLLKILGNILPKDNGTIITNGQKIGYLKQEIDHKFNELTILEYIKKDIGIDKIENKLSLLEKNLNENNMEEYSEVLNNYLFYDGYSLEENLNSILLGLKCKHTIYDKVKVLSGGEKIKILIANLLLSKSDIFLLDEPTNNLDIESIEWFEKYLIKCKNKMIIVSHDEIFLNKVTTKLFELDKGNLIEYNLNYSEYIKFKEKEYIKKMNEYNRAQEERKKIQKKINKTKEWIDKGEKTKAFNDNDKIANNYAKEKTNNSTISKLNKQLDKLIIPEFEEKETINMFFCIDTSKTNKDIEIENLICGYEHFKTKKINLMIPFKSKIIISGNNGSGKTTFIKTLLGEINPLSGKIIVGNGVKFGYVSQDTFTSKKDDTIMTFLTKNKDDYDLSKIFVLLNKVKIKYEDKDKLYNCLSPGERTRINIVKLILDNVNVLVLDEVTNHLDTEALNLVFELVNNFHGTIISISHNRQFNKFLNPDIIFDLN